MAKLIVLYVISLKLQNLPVKLIEDLYCTRLFYHASITYPCSFSPGRHAYYCVCFQLSLYQPASLLALGGDAEIPYWIIEFLPQPGRVVFSSSYMVCVGRHVLANGEWLWVGKRSSLGKTAGLEAPAPQLRCYCRLVPKRDSLVIFHSSQVRDSSQVPELFCDFALIIFHIVWI